MERTRYTYQVISVVRLTAFEVEVLAFMCAHHYDQKVRSLVTPGPEAVLNGARNDIRYGNDGGPQDYADLRLTRDQLSLMVKAAENVGGRGAHPYHRDLMRLYQDAGNEFEEVNHQGGTF